MLSQKYLSKLNNFERSEVENLNDLDFENNVQFYRKTNNFRCCDYIAYRDILKQKYKIYLKLGMIKPEE